MKLYTLLALIALPWSARASEYPIDVCGCHDADTLTCTIELGFGVQLTEVKVRVLGFDAWEVTRTRQTVGTITDAEIVKGKEATRFAVDLFGNAKVITGEPPKQWRDPYGRTLLRIKVDGKDYGDIMRAKGYERK